MDEEPLPSKRSKYNSPIEEDEHQSKIDKVNEIEGNDYEEEEVTRDESMTASRSRSVGGGSSYSMTR